MRKYVTTVTNENGQIENIFNTDTPSKAMAKFCETVKDFNPSLKIKSSSNFVEIFNMESCEESFYFFTVERLEEV